MKKLITDAEFCEKFIGVEWVNRGESSKGIDCWGLCMASFREIEGVELPQVAGYANKECSTGDALTKEYMSMFTPCQPMNGAIMAIFDNKANLVHVGRVLCGRVLHATKGLGVRWDTYQAINSRNNNVRYFKFEGQQ